MDRGRVLLDLDLLGVGEGFDLEGLVPLAGLFSLDRLPESTLERRLPLLGDFRVLCETGVLGMYLFSLLREMSGDRDPDFPVEWVLRFPLDRLEWFDPREETFEGIGDVLSNPVFILGGRLMSVECRRCLLIGWGDCWLLDWTLWGGVDLL